MLTKGVTCSKDKSDDLFRAEEPNDEFYHGNTIEDQINLDKTEIKQIIMKTLKLKSMLNIKEEMEMERWPLTQVPISSLLVVADS